MSIVSNSQWPNAYDNLVAGPTGSLRNNPSNASVLNALQQALGLKGAYNFLSTGPIVEVVAPTGVPAIDQANIVAAIAQVQALGGGTVQLRAGAYAVSSAVHIDTCSNAGPGTTWTDTSGSLSTADVGKYVTGPYVVGSGGIAGRAPKILTVNPGTGFTTDIAPGSAVVSQNMWITAPAILLPEGISIRGCGGIIGGGTSNYWNGVSATYGTAIIDSGTGVTIMTRGSNSYGARYGLYNLVVWGGAGAWGGSGYTGNALVGIFISNNSWWFEMDSVDVSYYKTAGIALDGNMNAQEFRNGSCQHIGTVGSTTPTGGILCYFFSGKVTSAGINVTNYSIDNLYGSGIAGGPGGGPGGGNSLAAAVNAHGCQFWNCSATSWSTYSGFGMVTEADYTSGKCVIDGCWFGTNGTGDLWHNGGSMVVTNTTFTSSVASPVTNWGNLTLIGCDIYATSANAVSQHGSINAIGVTLQGSATNLYSSGPSAPQCLGVVTSVGVALAGTSYSNP